MNSAAATNLQLRAGRLLTVSNPYVQQKDSRKDQVLSTSVGTLSGSISVIVGGQVVKTASLVTSTTRKLVLVSVTFSSVKTGTVEIKVTSANGKRVVVDGLGVSLV